MAEEVNVHQKVALADVFGCFLVGWVALFVSMMGFKQIPGFGTFLWVIVLTGVGCVIVTYMMYKNENILGTAIFGPLAVSFLAFGMAFSGVFTAGVVGNELALLIAFIGVVLLIDAVLSLLQPVKMLTIVLFIAAIGYFILALNLSKSSDTLMSLIGVFFILLSITATYLGTAVAAFVMKGKPILPLLIMTKK